MQEKTEVMQYKALKVKPLLYCVIPLGQWIYFDFFVFEQSIQIGFICLFNYFTYHLGVFLVENGILLEKRQKLFVVVV